MTYDCINGWEDMIDALNLDLNAEGIDADDAQEVATLALNRIAELQRAEKRAQALLELVEAAEVVIASWERGDLAGAVRNLDAHVEWARELIAKS